MASKEIKTELDKAVIDITNLETDNGNNDTRIQNLEFDTMNNNGLGQLTRTDQITGLLPPSVIPMGGGGSCAVDSVNGNSGVVIIDADDIPESLTRLWLTPAITAQIVTNTDEISQNNGLGELTRTDVVTGLLPQSVLPPSTGPSERHEWSYSSQPLANAAWVTYTGGSVVQNDGLGTFDANGIFTCKVAGTYIIYLNSIFSPNATGDRSNFTNFANPNGDGFENQNIVLSVGGSDDTKIPYSIVRDLAVNQTFQLKTWQSSGGFLNSSSSFKIVQIS